MLSKPYWVIGAIGLPNQSPDKLAVHTFDRGPTWDRQPSVVSLALCELLSAIANGRDISSIHPLSGFLQDPDREKDGSPDAKSLH